MNLFSIDQTKCNQDGICAAECPVGIIEFSGQGTFPAAAPNAGELCINCGHCVAVCPKGALSHRSMAPEQCPPVNEELQLNPEQVEHFLRARRSIRTYKDTPVALRNISKLIDIARFAPSGHNSQAVKWIVVYDKEKVNKLSGMVLDWMRNMAEKQPKMAENMGIQRMITGWESGKDYILRGAPHVIIAHAPTIDSTAQSACTIALSYLELAATSFEIGACWAGYLQIAIGFWPPLQEELSLPKGHKCHGAMMIGYPKFKYHQLPLRNDPEVTWC